MAVKTNSTLENLSSEERLSELGLGKRRLRGHLINAKKRPEGRLQRKRSQALSNGALWQEKGYWREVWTWCWGSSSSRLSAGAGGPDRMTSWGPFQPQPSWDSVKVLELCKKSILITSFWFSALKKESSTILLCWHFLAILSTHTRTDGTGAVSATKSMDWNLGLLGKTQNHCATIFACQIAGVFKENSCIFSCSVCSSCCCSSWEPPQSGLRGTGPSLPSSCWVCTGKSELDEQFRKMLRAFLVALVSRGIPIPSPAGEEPRDWRGWSCRNWRFW